MLLLLRVGRKRRGRDGIGGTYGLALRHWGV